jgi:hypothetical protein
MRVLQTKESGFGLKAVVHLAPTTTAATTTTTTRVGVYRAIAMGLFLGERGRCVVLVPS